MVLGVAYYTIVILASSIGADDVQTETSEVLDTSSLKQSGDVLVSVGLMYGSEITTGFQCVSSDGYILGVQELDGNRNFTEIWSLRESTVACTADANLDVSGGSYTIARRASEAVVGGYHIEVDCSDLDRYDVEDIILDNESYAERYGYTMIPSYIDGTYRIRMGSFSSADDAENAIRDAEDIFRNRRIDVAYPTDTAVSVINPYDNRILFEFDCGGKAELGLEAQRDRNGNTYIMTPAGNIYDGVFCFKRTDNGEVDGVSLINILPLEAYIAGVLPYETSNEWPLETLKAFAITVRSFTLAHPGKHDRDHFDFCNTVDCQVYRGAGRINQTIMDAVLGTEGKIMVCGDEIVTAYYSSSMGGVTVSAQDAWGGSEDVPYLQAKETPWENYMIHENGFWIYEVSPTQLLDRLNRAGYEELRGEIEDVEIVALAKNSTYVKTLRVTDIYGTSVTINYTDKVRTSLTPYVRSANFVVGQGQVEYTEDVVIDYVDPTSAETVNPENGGSYGVDYGYINLDEYCVITADSLEKSYFNESVQLLTGDGAMAYQKRDVFAITRQNAAAFLGEDYADPTTKDKAGEEPTASGYTTETVEDKSTSTVRYKIAYAEDPDNFIFVGKGWGHGVGMSQWGARDLAAKGYKAEEILDAYFTDVEIVDYRRR